jgi:hypothetical protein
MNPDKRLFIARMRTRAFVNQRLIRFTAQKSTADVDLFHALLNSVLGLFYIEALGFGRGLAVLDINATKLKEQMRILNPAMVTAECRQKILAAFQPLLSRPVLPLPEELDCRDRFQFDQEVLAAFDSRAFYRDISVAAKTLFNIRRAARPNL